MYDLISKPGKCFLCHEQNDLFIYWPEQIRTNKNLLCRTCAKKYLVPQTYNETFGEAILTDVKFKELTQKD